MFGIKTRKARELEKLIELQKSNLINQTFELLETRNSAQQAEKELSQIISIIRDYDDLTPDDLPPVDYVSDTLKRQFDAEKELHKKCAELTTALENAINQLSDNESAYKTMKQKLIDAQASEKRIRNRLEISRKLRNELWDKNSALKKQIAGLEVISLEHEALLKDRSAAGEIIDRLNGLIDKYTKRIEEHEAKLTSSGDCAKCAKIHRDLFIDCKNHPHDAPNCPKDVQKKVGITKITC